MPTEYYGDIQMNTRDEWNRVTHVFIRLTEEGKPSQEFMVPADAFIDAIPAVIKEAIKQSKKRA